MEDRERWWKMGMKAISEGKLAVLLLSGGQVIIHLALCFICQILYSYALMLDFYIVIKSKSKIQFLLDSLVYDQLGWYDGGCYDVSF